MKKILLCSTALLLCAGQSFATSGVYVAPKLGWSNGQIESVGVDYADADVHFAERDIVPTKDDDNSNVFAMGIAAGYQYDKWLVPFRMETEYLYRNHYHYDTGFCDIAGCPPESNDNFRSDVDTQTLLANFYIDLPVISMFSLFLGGGVGAALSDTDSHLHILGDAAEGSSNDFSFSWMGTAGVSVTPLNWLALDVSYRYSDLGNLTWRTQNSFVAFEGEGSSLSAFDTENFTAQEIFLGIRMLLPSSPSKQHPRHTYLDK